MDNPEKFISNAAALTAQEKGAGIIVDVREPAEFAEGHIPNAVNLPSTNFCEKDYVHWAGRKICLVCQTGDRARSVAHKLCQAGMEEVYVLEQQMEHIHLEASFEGWSVDRQFRFALGGFLAIFLIGSHWLSSFFIAIPVILCLGLIITAIIDKCYLRIGIAMLPWNRKRV